MGWHAKAGHLHGHKGLLHCVHVNTAKRDHLWRLEVNRHMPDRSTSILQLAKKSVLMKGKHWKHCQLKTWPPVNSCTQWWPQAFKRAPEAAVRAGLGGWAELVKGRME